jgi:Arc/MetJ-type ribon-helix-helix transcriptional regulator
LRNAFCQLTCAQRKRHLTPFPKSDFCGTRDFKLYLPVFPAAQPVEIFQRVLSALRRNPFSRILKAMDVQLTPDQKAFARRAIESGRLHSEQDAVQEALALWEERERQRTEFLLTLDDAKASLARGEGRTITQESMRQVAQEVKERGRARLLAELTTSR